MQRVPHREWTACNHLSSRLKINKIKKRQSASIFLYLSCMPDHYRSWLLQCSKTKDTWLEFTLQQYSHYNKEEEQTFSMKGGGRKGCSRSPFSEIRRSCQWCCWKWWGEGVCWWDCARLVCLSVPPNPLLLLSQPLQQQAVVHRSIRSPPHLLPLLLSETRSHKIVYVTARALTRSQNEQARVFHSLWFCSTSWTLPPWQN